MVMLKEHCENAEKYTPFANESYYIALNSQRVIKVLYIGKARSNKAQRFSQFFLTQFLE